MRLDKAADDTVPVNVNGREKYVASVGLQRYRKTIKVEEIIKTEKDQVKEILEMLEAQRKNRVTEMKEGEGE